MNTAEMTNAQKFHALKDVDFSSYKLPDGTPLYDLIPWEWLEEHHDHCRAEECSPDEGLFNEERQTRKVAAALRLLNPALNAESFNSGGGIFCVSVEARNVALKRTGDLSTTWGMSGEFWGCDVYVREDAGWDRIVGWTFIEGLSSEERDANLIAQRINAAMRDVQAGRFTHTEG